MRIGRQPEGSEMFLDHIAHWLPERESAARALTALGFTLTPFSEQVQPGLDGTPVPAGSGNHCVMLEQGYLEFLVPLADTVIGRELRHGIERYVGVHIAAFAVADAAAKHAALEAAGFRQRPLTALSRPVIDANDQRATARFSVARPEAGVIAEGRVQFLTHHTPELIWQERYVAHANSARRLTGMVLVVTDLEEAVARYRQLFDVPGRAVGNGHLFTLDHGEVALFEQSAARKLPGTGSVPDAPAMLNYAVECADVEVFNRRARSVSPDVKPWGSSGAHVVTLPASLGASLIAIPPGVGLADLLG